MEKKRIGMGAALITTAIAGIFIVGNIKPSDGGPKQGIVHTENSAGSEPNNDSVLTTTPIINPDVNADLPSANNQESTQEKSFKDLIKELYKFSEQSIKEEKYNPEKLLQNFTDKYFVSELHNLKMSVQKGILKN